MRNPSTWQVYAQGSQPAMNYGGRGYTGHEQLNQFGLINMNARLYDPILGRFLAPDPYVGSGMTNDFNRYVYARNNPMMYTDPSGKNFWTDLWSAFKRDFSRTFLSGGPGFEIGYNSMGGGFINPTYNGAAWGPSGYISNSGQLSVGNGTNGFHNNVSSNRINNKLEQSVVQAEQKARSEYFGQEVFEAIYNSVVDIKNTLFGGPEDIQYPTMAMGVAGYTSDIGSIAETSSGIKFGSMSRLSVGFGALNTGAAYVNLYNNQKNILNWGDALMGSAGLTAAALEYAGVIESIHPVVGCGLLIYNGLRLYQNYSNPQNSQIQIMYRTPRYNPTYYNYPSNRSSFRDYLPDFLFSDY